MARRLDWLAAAVVTLAAALRLNGLGTVFPVDDEFQQFFEALHPAVLSDFWHLPAQNPHHALLDALSTFVAAHFGFSLRCLRFPSALWGVLAVWLLWRLGRGLGRPGTGLGAAFLLSISLLHIDWSRRTDFYALLTLLSIWSLREFFRLLDRPQSWWRHTLCCVLFLYSHPYAVLMALLQFLTAMLWPPKTSFRETLKTLAISWALAVVCFLPWFFLSTASLIDAHFMRIPWRPGMLTWREFLTRLPLFMGQAPETGMLRTWQDSSASLLSLTYAALYIVSLTRTARGKAERLLRFVHLALPLGTGAVLALDYRYAFYLNHRQLLWLMPFYLIAVSDGTAWLLKSLRPRRVLATAAILSLTAFMLFLPAYLETTAFQNGMLAGYKRVVDDVARHIRTGDVLAFQNDSLAADFLFFYDRDAFRRIRDSRFINGQLAYVIPDGLLAHRGPAANAVFLLRENGSLEEAVAPPSRLWRFEGTLYDFSVRPPLRAPS